MSNKKRKITRTDKEQNAFFFIITFKIYDKNKEKIYQYHTSRVECVLELNMCMFNFILFF
jgi:hypothetical protein